MINKAIPSDPLARKVISFLLVFQLLALLPVVILSFSKVAFLGFCIAASVLFISAGVFVWLNSRYQSFPEVRSKRALEDRIRANQSQIQSAQILINKANATRIELTTAERSELASALRSLQDGYIRQGLSAARIDEALIPGIGPKLKERLAAYRILAASDISQTRLASIDGFGIIKVQAMMIWRSIVQARLERNKPSLLPESQAAAISQKYLAKQAANDTTERNAGEKKAQSELELAALEPEFLALANLTFTNYLGQTLTFPGFIVSSITAVLVICQLCLGGAATLQTIAGLPPAATQTQAAEVITSQASVEQSLTTDVTSSAPTITPTHAQAPGPNPTDTVLPVPTLVFPTEMPAFTATAEPATQGIEGELTFQFVNVGQGDATLIQTPGGKTILIDGGEKGSGIVQYLQGLGIQRIDLMIATHPHSDHIGGLVQVLEAFPVDRVVTNGQPHTTVVYERFIDGIIAAQAEYVEARRGDVIAIDGLNIEVLHPAAPTDSDLNENSLVLKFKFGQTTFLLMGDAEAGTEASLLSSGLSLKADILKVGHHGSTSSSTTAFLKAVSPQIAIYSAGINNQYNHPAPETIAALAGLGATVLGTDQSGTIAMTVEQLGYKFASAITETGPPGPAPTSVVPVSPSETNPTQAPVVQPTAAATAPVAGGLEIMVTSPVNAGANATLTAQTTPNASCTIVVNYKSGPSTAQGLDRKTADSSGKVSWTWKVGTRTTPGSWRIDVTCDGIYKSIFFTVQ